MMSMEVGTQLTDAKEDKPHMPYPFQEIIGMLMYAMTAT